MLPCPLCGTINPLGTRFCRGCGEKITVTYQQVAQSVNTVRSAQRADRVSSWGRSLLHLAIFFLACALIFRFLLVPKMPRAEPVAPVPAQLIPTEAPAGDPAAAPIVLLPASLAVRATTGRTVLAGIGSDAAAIAAIQRTLVADQRPDGSFPGGDPIVATGLAACALQALPGDAAVDAAAVKARAFLRQKIDRFVGLPPLARVFLAAPLIDAGDLSASQVASIAIFLADGKVPAWQAWAIAALPPEQRPAEQVALRSALKSPPWPWLLALVQGQDPVKTGIPGRERQALYAETGVALKTGEDRLAWAWAAWHLAIAPRELSTALRAWVKAGPAAVAPELMQAAGPHAAESVHVLALAAPIRLPPLWFAPTR